MKKDHFFYTILVSIVLLAVIALVLFFTRQGDQEYVADDNPEGVVHNYLLALQREDYQRAYSYLQEGPGKPSSAVFQTALLSMSREILRTAVQLGETGQRGELVTVELSVLHSGTGPFSGGWRDQSQAILIQDAGKWKIASIPYPFWDFGWYLGKNPEIPQD